MIYLTLLFLFFTILIIRLKPAIDPKITPIIVNSGVLLKYWSISLPINIPANIQNASSVPTITNLNQVFFFANYDFPTFLADSIHFSMVSSKSLYECACETNIVSNWEGGSMIPFDSSRLKNFPYKPLSHEITSE